MTAAEIKRRWEDREYWDKKNQEANEILNQQMQEIFRPMVDQILETLRKLSK